MMNTKIVLAISSIVLGVSGIVLTFAPDFIVERLFDTPNKTTQLLLQIIGGCYFAFSMMNWMIKESLIGGIYNRPIAVTNFTHFLIAGLAVLKALNSNPQLSLILWVTGIVYVIFGILFGLILFRHPVKSIE